MVRKFLVGGWHTLDVVLITASVATLRASEVVRAGDVLERVVFHALDVAHPFPGHPVLKAVIPFHPFRVRAVGLFWRRLWNTARKAMKIPSCELVLG